MARRKCEQCGKSFEAKRSTAKYCGSSCRVSATRARNATSTAPEVPAELQAWVTSRSPVRDATRAELEAAGRFDTALGQVAMALAAWMDSPACTSPSSVAKELRATIVEATKGAARKSSPEKIRDELAERRRKRGA